MKEWDEIWKQKEIKTYEPWLHGYSGILELKGNGSPLIFVATIDDDGKGLCEHVSVHIRGSLKKTPTWDEMCRIKDIFWNDEDEVHQVHPRKSEYVHSCGPLENVLHLWRPVNGWKWQ